MSHVDEGTLHAYLDGELSAMEAVRLEKHTTECPACRDRLGEARTLVRQASQLLDAATPPVRAAPPLDELREPRLGWRVRVPLAWAATVILALGAGWYVGIRGRESGAGKQTAARAPTHADTARPIVVATRTGPAAGAQSQAPPQPEQKGEAQGAAAPLRYEDRALAAREGPQAADSTAQAQPRAQPSAPVASVARALPAQERPAQPLSEARARSDAATAWGPVSADSARALLGSDAVAIPDIPVRRILASDRTVVVEQPLDSAAVIYLYERNQAAPGRSSERLARYVGSLRVEISGPVAVDSLNKLLDSLKPMR